MHTYVLVNARWHGAWCWDRVAAALRHAGHTVHTPDRATVEEIRDLVVAQPEPVVLVGHSSSGMQISAVAELAPQHVRTLVYIAAFLLPNDVVPPDVMRDDTESVLRDHLVLTNGELTVSEPEKVLFEDCPPAVAAWASAQLVPEPAIPLGGPEVLLTDQNFGRIPRVYVECLNDRALGITTQRRMHTALPCAQVHTLPSGHSPFLSMPDRLAACLLDVERPILRAD
ncbi:alpha/beta fold hydrolase [Allokutzneria oryzae]|uniref:Alpha/beta fold hydrolase n=1 Tax=Allokutzneria oryzae TaxID=1378989 RepID=A0ABV5ZR40_9PSEU